MRDLGIESDDGVEVLSWWCQHSNRFPVLSKLAQDFLAIPSSGAGVERLFNSAHDICHYQWGKLHAETIEALMVQMCTDRFAIASEYAELLDDMDDKPLSLEQANMSSVQEDEAIQFGYISDGDEGNLSRDEDEGHDGQSLPRQPLVQVEVPRLKR